MQPCNQTRVKKKTNEGKKERHFQKKKSRKYLKKMKMTHMRKNKENLILIDYSLRMMKLLIKYGLRLTRFSQHIWHLKSWFKVIK